MECLEKVYPDSMSSQELVSCHLSERRCKNSSRSTESIVCHISSRRKMPMLQLLKLLQLQQMKKRVWLALQLPVLQQAPPGQVQHLLKTKRKKPKRKRKQKRRKKL